MNHWQATFLGLKQLPRELSGDCCSWCVVAWLICGVVPPRMLIEY
jgi:hypothetical protein